MKPAIVWRLRDQAAFDRAMELQFGRFPNKKIIDLFLERLNIAVERAAVRTSFDPNAEHSMKIGVKRVAYQVRPVKPPVTPGNQVQPSRKPAEKITAPVEPAEEWLEVRFRFVDDGKTAEIVSVTSKNFPNI